MNRPRPSQPSFPRRGFTLIEVLVVITILAILVALLVPALGSAQLRARVVQVRTDISALESAIAQFKSDFGSIEPPSGIIFYENANDWTTNANNPAVARSRSIIRQLWPQYDFGTSHDINRDNDMTDTFDLGGSECLVFFLGGAIAVDDTNGNGYRDGTERVYHNGFSKNPANPFAVGGNRQGPFFEFRNDRLIESTFNPGFFAYRDPWPSQTAPYVYVSSYGGKGYRLGDLGAPPVPGQNQLRYWYLQGATSTSPAWLATKYQIISPGPDGQYGIGGPFQPTQPIGLPGWTQSIPLPVTTWTAADRAAEADNITNFHSGRLSDK